MTEVVLLTKDDCHFCEQAKGVLERLQGEYERELPLASDEGRELAERSGALFPPVLLVDGEPFSYGRLSERKLRKALAA
ncbi:MAG: glutaredoxin family protein [Gaiellaceae bacterium]